MPGTRAVASTIASATEISDPGAGPLRSGPGVLTMVDWRLLFGVDSYKSDWGAGRLTLMSRTALHPTACTPKRRMIALAVLLARALRSASLVLRTAITACRTASECWASVNGARA